MSRRPGWQRRSTTARQTRPLLTRHSRRNRCTDRTWGHDRLGSRLDLDRPRRGNRLNLGLSRQGGGNADRDNRRGLDHSIDQQDRGDDRRGNQVRGDGRFHHNFGLGLDNDAWLGQGVEHGCGPFTKRDRSRNDVWLGRGVDHNRGLFAKLSQRRAADPGQDRIMTLGPAFQLVTRRFPRFRFTRRRRSIAASRRGFFLLPFSFVVLAQPGGRSQAQPGSSAMQDQFAIGSVGRDLATLDQAEGFELAQRALDRTHAAPAPSGNGDVARPADALGSCVEEQGEQDGLGDRRHVGASGDDVRQGRKGFARAVRTSRPDASL